MLLISIITFVISKRTLEMINQSNNLLTIIQTDRIQNLI